MILTGVIIISAIASLVSVYRETRGTSAQSALIGWFISLILVLGLAWLDWAEWGPKLSILIECFLISFLVLFSAEIKRILSRLDLRPRWRVQFSEEERDLQHDLCRELANAADSLSKKREGALMVIEQRADLGEFLSRGVEINAQVKSSLIHAIFCHNGNDFHDGAVVIRQGEIWQAKAFLPMPHSIKLSQKYGTRHLAAVGITDQTDALVIVVSEERGTISLVYAGQITELSDRYALEKALQDHLL
jgi:diadenylate cyclase